MAAKKDDSAVKRVLARVIAGNAVTVEEARRAATAAGYDEDELNTLVNSPQPKVQWENPETTQGSVPVEVATHKAAGEQAANDALKDQEFFDAGTQGTGSNDPEVNPLATGGQPFEKTSGVGHSGQVIDPQDYRPKEEAKA